MYVETVEVVDPSSRAGVRQRAVDAAGAREDAPAGCRFAASRPILRSLSDPRLLMRESCAGTRVREVRESETNPTTDPAECPGTIPLMRERSRPDHAGSPTKRPCRLTLAGAALIGPLSRVDRCRARPSSCFCPRAHVDLDDRLGTSRSRGLARRDASPVIAFAAPGRRTRRRARFRNATNALVCAGQRRATPFPEERSCARPPSETTPSSPEQPRWKGLGPAISPPLSDKEPLARFCVVDADSRARPRPRASRSPSPTRELGCRSPSLG